jgi:hypothetical protein
LVAVISRTFFIAAADVQLAMAALCLDDIGALLELAWFTSKSRLMFALAARRLVLTVVVAVHHEVADAATMPAPTRYPACSDSLETKEEQWQT